MAVRRRKNLGPKTTPPRTSPARGGATLAGSPSKPIGLQTLSQFVSSQYPLLFHYTDAAGLKGILEQNEFWATHYQHLNDFNEVTESRGRILPTALKLAMDRFSWWKDDAAFASLLDMNGGYEDVVTKEITNLLDVVFRTTTGLAPPYFVSFASHDTPEEVRDGSLDLWRAYSRGAGGYCLVIDTAALEQLTLEEVTKHKFHMLHMADIKYAMGGDEAELLALCEALISTLNGFHKMYGLPVRGEVIDPEALFQPSALEITRHKSWHFRNEREVRLVASPYRSKLLPKGSDTSRPVFHRVSGGGLVPTMKVFGNDVDPLPISRIIVGPSDRQDQLVLGTRSFVAALGRTIEVAASTISYRMM